MVTLKKFNLRGEEIGSVEISEALAQATAHSQLIKDYLVAVRYNARQWSANTKTRSEVKHTTKKPFAQKGQGRARQGCLVAPQYKGGGRVFGPKPKFDVRIRMNQKEKQSSVLALLAEKFREGRVAVVDSLSMEAPKTRVVSSLLSACSFPRRVLVLGAGSYFSIGDEDPSFRMSVGTDCYDVFKLSIRNLSQVSFSLVRDIDGYSVAKAHDLLITEDALNELERWVKEGDKHE